MVRFLALAVLLGAVPLPVVAQTTTSVPAATASPASRVSSCPAAEYRQLDFWVGEWALSWAGPNGQRRTGTNRITRDEYGTCVITEHFRSADGSLKGHSVSSYLAPAKAWRQTWVDDQGGYITLTGGPVSGQKHGFELESYLRQPGPALTRMIWEDVKADSLVWRWQKRAPADGPWQDVWVVNYTRIR